MPLEPGSTLGVYQVTGQIGAGGMGEVYKARDTKLGRDVALKILPNAFVNDAERLARFQREAKVLASLNHPNIAAIYGLEDDGDSPALVLEYVEGPTLQDRIGHAQSPIPLDEALPIARQIAEALEAAHEQGIIHRDLKPANVKVKDDGTVKVLDFGLAKALEAEQTPEELANSPTVTAAGTRDGVILGTAAYMSPEQARGRPLDKRTDIWSFGCVLYEMLAGRLAFSGQTVSDVLAAVLTREPDWGVLPESTPFLVRRLVRRCVEKTRRDRMPDIAMARIEIDEALETSTPTPVAESAGAVPAAPSRGWLAWSIAGVMAAIAVLLALTLAVPGPGQVDAPRRITRFEIQRPETNRQFAVSPDGTRLLYLSSPSEWVMRRFDELEARPLPGAEGGGDAFFSPDGQRVGFHAAGQVKTVSANGGVAVTLADLPDGAFGMNWGDDGNIYFGGANLGLWRVADTGGEPQALTTPDTESGELDWHHPWVLPGSEAVLFGLHDQNRGFRVEVLALATGERKILVESGFQARYVPTGHILYGRESALWAMPFDLARLEVTGPSVRILENVRTNTFSGYADFRVAADGALAYTPAPSLDARTLAWVDRDGSVEPLPVEPQAYSAPRLSPDGDRLAVAIRDGDSQDIWVYDLSTDTWRRVTFEGRNLSPVWTPDGTTLVFASDRAGKSDIYRKPAGGGGTAELLLASGLWTTPTSWNPEGNLLAFREEEATGMFHASTLGVSEDRSPQQVQVLGALTGSVRFSPDGRFIAYRGSGEIHVRPFPEVDEGQWQVSTNGGSWPVWGRQGRELFYRQGNAIVAVPVVTTPAFEFGAPRELFRREIASWL
ncbi:MAG: protein kinase, partial [Vicinamibacterales bacterium]|nr:protein kinase [Vicinamibacterales bacterium]